MRLLSAIVLGLSAACWPAVCGADSAPPEPVYTKNPRFGIPYQYDADEMRKLGAREVRLYGSVDRGETWQQLQSVPPEGGRFRFAAGGDGEYWFAVRTVDSYGRLHPAGDTFEPGLSVVVDSAAPNLQITLRQAEPGKVHLAWSADDEHLDPASLRLEYVQAGWTEWRKVIVATKAQGETSWTCPAGGLVAVRGRIADRAGNTGSAQSQIAVVPANRPAPKPVIPDLNQPIASDSGEEAAPPGEPVISQVTVNPSSDEVRSAPATNPLEEAAPQAFRRTRPRDGDSHGPVILPRGNERPIAETSPRRPNPPQDRPAAAGQTGSPREAAAPVRVVNSRRFEIGYELDGGDSSSIGSIELCITPDGGNRWYRYGVDPDRRSPFEVVVPEEGRYGFALRARNSAGVGARLPRPGDSPEFTVAVDQTPPVIELMPVEQGRGAAGHQLLIRWKIEEEHPAERPISLSYSPVPGGPWQPLVEAHPDTGSFVWTVQPGFPERLYLRATARDAAGNTAHAEPPQPIVFDSSRPSPQLVERP